jgi:hypothetical protein
MHNKFDEFNADDLDSIGTAINEDLCVEILWSAMNALKQNPNLSIQEAIDMGYGEWIK